MLQHGLGIHFLSAWTCDFFLPIGIIAYANFNYKIHFFNKKLYPYTSIPLNILTFLGKTNPIPDKLTVFAKGES